MTPAEHTCPECGARLPADAVRGICPRCLLRRALEADATGDVSHGADRTIHLVLPQDAATGAPIPFRELGDYELLAEIGRGGMGIIYQARQRSLDRLVAIKLIRSGALARPEDIARFRNEAAAAARLKHPHIVAIHEVGEHEGHHFYSMDLVPGRSLSAVLREGPFTPKRAAQCVRTVAEAIHYAHERGVLHRDLKPSNILLDAEDEPHVADFGLAKLLHSDSELTLTGAVLGSPNYMPPEQARGKHAEVSAHSDVYSLGAILYECLTGRPPFTAATPLETMKLVVEQEPVSPRVLNPSLPRDLETICLKCLAKEPARRYPTAQELADELSRFLADEPIRARPAGIVERGWRWCRRKPAVAALFAVIATSAVALVAVLVSSNSRVRHALDHAVSEGERASNALIRAQSETRRAETNAELNRLNLYAAMMYLADRALKEGNTYQAHRTLEELRPREGETDLRGFEWHLLWKTASGEQAAIWSGHSNAVLCLALSPDGNTLASGGMDAQIRLWDAKTGAERGMTNTAYRPEQTGIGVVDFVVGFSLPGAPKVVRSVEFTRDGGLLVAGCGSSMFLKSATLERVFSHDGERSAASRLLPESSLLVGIELAEQSTLRVYDWKNTSVGRLGASAPSILAGVAGLKLERTLTNLPPVFAVSPRGALWASCTWSNDLLIWRQAEPTPIQSRRTSALATALAFSPDGKRLAVATAKPELEIHQLAGPQPPARFALPGRAQALSWSPDGRRLATAGKDQTVSVWDSVTGKLERRFVGHLGPVNAVIFSQDGRRLFSGGDDGSIRVWELDAASGELLITNGWSPYVFSPDGRQIVGRLVARTRDHGRVCRWDADTGAKAVLSDRTSVPAFFTGHGMEMGAFTYQGSNQSLRVDFMLPDGTASRPSNWIEGRSGTPSRPSAKLPLTLLNAFSTPGPVYQRSIAFSSTGKLCAVSYSDCLVEIWNPAEGRRLAEFDSLNVWPAEPRFSADLRWLAFRATHHWEVWNLGEQKRVIRREQKTGSTFHSPVFTTQPSVMYFGGEGADIRRVDLRTGEDLPSLVGHAEKVVALALSPDERTLASGGSDQEIKFWHVASGREVASRRLEQGVIWLEFSPDNQRLAVLEDNQSLRLLHAPKAK